MSDEIARVSHDLARNLRLLSSKEVDDVTVTSSTLTSSLVGPSEADSLERTPLTVESPPTASLTTARMDKGARKTWEPCAGVAALDSLMLSNVCALSARLCAVADSLTGKLAILHGGSAPYDLSRSQVPLLQQTGTQEMATIVNNLRHVEMQLLRADEIVDPSQKLKELLNC